MNRIKKVFQEKGIKQTWLAEKMSESFNMVNDYCNNKRHASLQILFQVSEVLNTDVKELIGTKTEQ